MMEKTTYKVRKTVNNAFWKDKAKYNQTRLNQFTQEIVIWESPTKQTQMIHHQGTDTSNAHLQFTQQLILRKLKVIV